MPDLTYREARRARVAAQLREVEARMARFRLDPGGGDDEGYLARKFDAVRHAWDERRASWLRDELARLTDE